jgi:hypothetical protein
MLSLQILTNMVNNKVVMTHLDIFISFSSNYRCSNTYRRKIHVLLAYTYINISVNPAWNYQISLTAMLLTIATKTSIVIIILV